MSLLLFDNFLTRMSRKRNYEGFAHISQSVYVTCNLKLNDFSRLQAVAYSVKVVIFPKQCKIDTLLLQTINRSDYGLLNGERIAAIPMTLTDRQCYSPIASILNGIFRTVVQQSTRF